MKNIHLTLFALLAFLLLTGCADAQPLLEKCLEGHVYGFWGGLWHGITVMISSIGALFMDGVAVWAVNNNGGWYNFGFCLGTGGFFVFIRAILGVIASLAR